ncbi:oligosaccharide flippase family protein [Priestia megaterium]|uniref:oligosaccharide flippase family protein n=1 Tax=Priestia megaterium TaxID=1404 RepID=UPI0030086D0C
MKKILFFLNNRKNFISFSLLRLGATILGLVSNIFIVRKLSVEDFGIFSLALTVISLFTTLGFSWSSSSILYYGSKEKAKYNSINKTFWSRNIIIFVSLIIVTIGFILFRNQINSYIGLDIWFLLLLWLYVSVIEDYLNQYFLAVKKQITSTMLSFTAKIFYIILISLVPFDVPTLVILNIVSLSSIIFYTLSINRKDISKFEFDKPWFKEVLNFSLWQLFGFAGVYLINFGDVAVIKYYMTNKDVGIYNAAYQLFMGVTGFANIISNYYAGTVSENFASNNKENIKQFYYKERLYIFAISIVGHIVLLIFSKYIILTIYGEKYIESVIILNILLIGSMIRFLERFYMLYYNTNRKYKLQQTINIFRAVFNVVLSIILIQFMGLIGPAVATTVVFIITFLFSVFYCEKRISLFIKD